MIGLHSKRGFSNLNAKLRTVSSGIISDI